MLGFQLRALIAQRCLERADGLGALLPSEIGVCFPEYPSVEAHGGTQPPAVGRGMWKDDLALYSSFFLSSHQHPAGSNGFNPNFCQSPPLLVLFFCRMEAGIGPHREPETPGLSFGLEAEGGVGCAVLAKSCLVSGK